MSGSNYLQVIVLTMPFIISIMGLSGYAAYRAFAIRKASLVPTHRYQALWVGATAIYWIVQFGFVIEALLYLLYPGAILAAKTLLIVSGIATLFFGLAFVFAWVDVNVLIARSSDPRNRDPFHWGYTRLIIWSAIFLNIVLASYFLIPSLLSTPITGGFGPYALYILFFAEDGLVYFAIPTICLAVLLVLYYHSRDPLLRKHLTWQSFNMSTLAFIALAIYFSRNTIAGFAFGSSPSSLGILFTVVVQLAFDFADVFSVYMCARSLAPISRFPPTALVDSRP
jgi:hypothetical protein